MYSLRNQLFFGKNDIFLNSVLEIFLCQKILFNMSLKFIIKDMIYRQQPTKFGDPEILEHYVKMGGKGHTG